MRALVLDSGQHSRSALAGVRALGMAGWEVGVAVPAGGRSLAARSRWCRQVVSGDAGRGAGYDVVVPAGDAEAFMVSRDRSDWACEVPFGPHEAVARLLDKSSLAALASECGLSVPRVVDGSRLPVVVKGRSHVAGRHEAVVARTRAQFDAACAALDEPLVQEFIDAPLVALAVARRDGRVVARVQQRALAAWGVSTRAVTEPVDVRLAEPVERMLAALEWWGLVQFQFLDGRLIDANPRLYGSLALAVAAGVNLPAVWLGGDGRWVEARPGVRYQWLEGDLRRNPRGALGSLAFAVGAHHSVLSARDPLPAVVHMGELARRAVRKVGR